MRFLIFSDILSTSEGVLTDPTSGRVDTQTHLALFFLPNFSIGVSCIWSCINPAGHPRLASYGVANSLISCGCRLLLVNHTNISSDNAIGDYNFVSVGSRLRYSHRLGSLKSFIRLFSRISLNALLSKLCLEIFSLC